MPNPYRDKLLSIGMVRRSSLTKPQVTEGRRHPDSGVRFKRTEDDAQIVTEHHTKTDRVDATAKVAAPIEASLADLRRRKEQATRGS